MAANSNTRTNTPTQVPALPAIPAGASPELRKYLETLSQVVSIRLGRRGDPRDRAVTLRELIDGGLAKEFASSPFDPNRSGNVGFASPQAFLADLAVPPAPTGFTVNGAYSQINLNWDYPAYSNHSHTEVHVHTSDVIGDATLLGIQTGRVFVDPVGSNQTRYYWIRHVNTDGIAGPFNSASGTAGTTATDVSHLLSVLSSSITSSELTQTLTDRIDLIDAAATVNGSVAYRVAEEASARAAAISAEASARATAISAEASARATAISAEASARAAAIAAIVTDISIHDSNQAYAVGQIVRISNSSSKLYICIQAIAANASVAVTNTAYWKLYGDYDALKSSTDTSAAAITQINTISSSSTSAAAAAINSLNSEVFDANGGSLLATASALNTVQAEVFPDGTSSASRLDTLDAEVFDSNGGSLLATAAALNTVQTEVFPDGTSNASRLDTLDAEVFDSNGGSLLATAAALNTVQAEVFPDGTSSASRLDTLDAEVFDSNGGSLLATAAALNTVQTEVFPDGTSNASRLDTLDAEVFDSNGGSLLATAAALNTVQAEVFPDGTSSASRLDTLDAEVFDSNGGSLLATAAALDTVQTEVFPDGTSSASRLDTLDGAVFDANGLRLATASALNTVQTEVFPNGTSSASRIDTLETTVNHADTGVGATATAVSALNTEVYGSGGGSSSRIDNLETTVNHADTGVSATATAVSALNTEIFPNGTSSSSRIDALDNILLDSNGSAVVSATNLSSMKNQILDSGGNQTATATQMEQLAASYTDPTTGQQNVTLETALETSASNVNGLRSQYSVKIDSNGNVAGFGLASTSSAAGSTSEFTVVADRFALVSPQDTLKTTPFVVQATATTLNGQSVPAGVYMDNAFIKNGSIEAAKIGSLNADKISSGFISADRIDGNSIEGSKLVLDSNYLSVDNNGELQLVTSNGSNGIKLENLSNDAVGTIHFANAGYQAAANTTYYTGSALSFNDFTSSSPFNEHSAFSINLPEIASTIVSKTKIKESGTYQLDFGSQVIGQQSGNARVGVACVIKRSTSTTFPTSAYSNAATAYMFGGDGIALVPLTLRTSLQLDAGYNYEFKLYGFKDGITSSNNLNGFAGTHLRLFRIFAAT